MLNHRKMSWCAARLYSGTTLNSTVNSYPPFRLKYSRSPFQRLAGAATTHGIDRCLHLIDPSFEQAAPLATNPRLTLRCRPAPPQGRDLAQMLHRMIEVHQLR